MYCLDLLVCLQECTANTKNRSKITHLYQNTDLMYMQNSICSEADSIKVLIL